ncbi:HAD family hydrolase [Paenibacillus hamazuiensis]|uniref:HAD family hydrolase n=1 Tax=Paenibacillus hamazuiensis TaxID=2936508 RepID=UPI0020109454|nr:HAD family hydrolase [Paenibacillus hamazuiensis]
MGFASGFPKLFVTDLDGTALGGTRPYSRFPDELSGLLDELDRRGCSWATNSTWDVKPQMQLVYASAVTSRPAYLIGGAGLQLCKVSADDIHPVEPYSSKMKALLEQVVRTELQPLIRAICGTFSAKTMSFNGFWFAMKAAEEEADQLMKLLEQKATQAPGLTIVCVPQERRFYAHPAFMRKGAGLEAILDISGFGPEDIVVAGDETMDLDMMRPELAAHVICPSNAHPIVKERVLQMGGVVGREPYGAGVVQAFRELVERRGWTIL